MRPSLIVSILFFSCLLHEAQGIRLERGFMQAGQQHKENNFLTERSNGAVGEVILCKEGHCTGMSRILITVTPSTSTSSKNNTNGGYKANANPTSKGISSNGEIGGEHDKVNVKSSPTSEHKEQPHGHYVDIMDIAEMDYSPASRKPPIHN